jgi:hypothetical protein
MEELADAWIVETRLPFLDQGQLETSVVRSFSVYWERRPAIQIVVLFPVAESQLSLDQPIVVELEKFLERLYSRSRVWGIADRT